MHKHRLPAAVLVIGSLTATLSACGGSSPSGTPSSSPGAGAASVAPALVDALGARIAAQTAFGHPQGEVEVDSGARFASLSHDDSALGLGLDAVASQPLSASGTGAMCRAMRFGSADAAATYRDSEPSLLKEVTTTTFAVPGVPGAIGYDQQPTADATSTHHSINVSFTVGEYEYYLGAAIPPGAKHPDAHDLATGARRWYAALQRLG